MPYFASNSLASAWAGGRSAEVYQVSLPSAFASASSLARSTAGPAGLAAAGAAAGLAAGATGFGASVGLAGAAVGATGVPPPHPARNSAATISARAANSDIIIPSRAWPSSHAEDVGEPVLDLLAHAHELADVDRTDIELVQAQSALGIDHVGAGRQAPVLVDEQLLPLKAEGVVLEEAGRVRVWRLLHDALRRVGRRHALRGIDDLDRRAFDFALPEDRVGPAVTQRALAVRDRLRDVEGRLDDHRLELGHALVILPAEL